MAAPIRKVAPSLFDGPAFLTEVEQGFAQLHAADSNFVHNTLATFGTVISSTVPGILGISAGYRAQLRRQIARK